MTDPKWLSKSDQIAKAATLNRWRIEPFLESHQIVSEDRSRRIAQICQSTFGATQQTENDGVHIAANNPAHVLKLNALLREMAEALEFYADLETYGSDDASRSTGNKCFDVVCFDFSRNLKRGKDYAGKRAREALARFQEGPQ